MSLMLAIALVALVPAASGCGGQDVWSGCDSVIDGGSLDISAGRTDSGSGGGSGGGGGDSGGRTVEESENNGLQCDDPLGRCGEYEVVTRPEATLTDVASFAPTLAPLAPEPNGIGVVGLPVNVVATAIAHTQDGELFDLPVSVRFRPVSFTFDYGDGTVRDSATGGATWAQLGLPQFTATDTSHAYSARGDYTVTAAVHYAADVDFGTGWIPVTGLLAVPAGATTVEIVEAHTALVERTCLEDPSGIGC